MKFSYQHSGLSATEIEKYSEKLLGYNSRLNEVLKNKDYSAQEASILLPSDHNIKTTVLNMVNKTCSKQLRLIFVVGIGGANLGAKAIYDAIYGHYDALELDRYPKIIFLDTQDDCVIDKIEKLINKLHHKDQVLVNAISKSGQTVETIVNFEILLSILKNKFGDVYNRLVITTDEDSAFYNNAYKTNASILTIPKMVGGRYSVFSTVGLFPIAASGIDIDGLLDGALNMRNKCVNFSVLENPAAISALLLYHHMINKKTINDNFIFMPRLESLGKWYRQLMGEGIGKDGKGITPTVSIGSTDLHSVAQLYLGGPKDKFTSFIYSASSLSGKIVPENQIFGTVPDISGKTVPEILKIMATSTMASYSGSDLPFVEIEIDPTVEDIASFMQFKMIEIMYLGNLMGINAFDQLHVELYKKEAKKLLNIE